MKIGKELRQRILDGEYPKIIKKSDIKKFEKSGTLTEDKLLEIQAADMFTLKATMASPAQHRIIDLGITEFKRRIKIDFPAMSKSARNKAIALYKKKAWVDFKETVGHKGVFPTYPT